MTAKLFQTIFETVLLFSVWDISDSDGQTEFLPDS